MIEPMSRLFDRTHMIAGHPVTFTPVVPVPPFAVPIVINQPSASDPGVSVPVFVDTEKLQCPMLMRINKKIVGHANIVVDRNGQGDLQEFIANVETWILTAKPEGFIYAESEHAEAGEAGVAGS